MDQLNFTGYARRPPHRSTEDFYDISYWCEATNLPAPPAAGMPANASNS